MPSTHRRSSRYKPAPLPATERLWQLGVFAVIGLALLPGNFAFVGYGAELAAQSYDLVKISMMLTPIGALLMLVWRKAEIQIVVLALFMVLLPALWLLPDWGWEETRNMLFAWPGLALGMSLATESQRVFAPATKRSHHRASRT